MFLRVVGLSVVIQVVLVQAAGMFTKTAGLTNLHWFISVALSVICLPLGIVMRFLPVTEDPNTFKGYTFATSENLVSQYNSHDISVEDDEHKEEPVKK